MKSIERGSDPNDTLFFLLFKKMYYHVQLNERVKNEIKLLINNDNAITDFNTVLTNGLNLNYTVSDRKREKRDR